MASLLRRILTDTDPDAITNIPTLYGDLIFVGAKPDDGYEDHRTEWYDGGSPAFTVEWKIQISPTIEARVFADALVFKDNTWEIAVCVKNHHGNEWYSESRPCYHLSPREVSRALESVVPWAKSHFRSTACPKYVPPAHLEYGFRVWST